MARQLITWPLSSSAFGSRKIRTCLGRAPAISWFFTHYQSIPQMLIEHLLYHVSFCYTLNTSKTETVHSLILCCLKLTHNSINIYWTLCKMEVYKWQKQQSSDAMKAGREKIFMNIGVSKMAWWYTGIKGYRVEIITERIIRKSLSIKEKNFSSTVGSEAQPQDKERGKWQGKLDTIVRYLSSIPKIFYLFN